MGSGQERGLVIGEGKEEDGQHASEEGGQTRVVDEVKGSDLAPGCGGSGQDGPIPGVVEHFAAHGGG